MNKGKEGKNSAEPPNELNKSSNSLNKLESKSCINVDKSINKSIETNLPSNQNTHSNLNIPKFNTTPNIPNMHIHPNFHANNPYFISYNHQNIIPNQNIYNNANYNTNRMISNNFNPFINMNNMGYMNNMNMGYMNGNMSKMQMPCNTFNHPPFNNNQNKFPEYQNIRYPIQNYPLPIQHMQPLLISQSPKEPSSDSNNTTSTNILNTSTSKLIIPSDLTKSQTQIQQTPYLDRKFFKPPIQENQTEASEDIENLDDFLKNINCKLHEFICTKQGSM